MRGEPKHFASSKVMCRVAADRGARLARIHDDHDLARRWHAAADEIRADVCANALDKRGVFTQSYGSDALDASVLLMPLVGFLPHDDERVRRTVLAIADELTVDGLVLRYRVEQTDDGLSGEEGTFTICSFWLVSALAEIGEIERARQLLRALGVRRIEITPTDAAAEHGLAEAFGADEVVMVGARGVRASLPNCRVDA